MQPVEAKILLKGMCDSAEGKITQVVTDSRRVVPGCVFVCFEGARVDGHSFAAGAVEKGAAYILALHPVDGVPPEKTILVEDPALAMVAMAANYRALFRPQMIGVTGSVGKTTTKEFCAAVLEDFGPTVKTEGNQNNEIGMPNTLFRLENSTRYAVVEMGMSHLGEISRLAQAARPSAGIITYIGVSHLENLGSRENILKAKLEICEGLEPGSPLVLNRDDELLRSASLPGHLRPVWVSLEGREADVWAEELCSEPGAERFVLCCRQGGRYPVRIPVMGRHCVRDALQAWAAAWALGLDGARAARALENYQTAGLRQHMVRRQEITLMEDCYNASPDSMRAALETFRRVEGRRHLALLGDMLELGSYAEKAHRELGVLAADSGLDGLFAYGPAAALAAQEAEKRGMRALCFADPEEAAKALARELEPGDALLVKGSRGMRLEEIIEKMWGYRAGQAGQAPGKEE